MRTILILCLSILFLPLTLAAEGDLTITGGTLNTDYSYTDNVYTVLTGTALTFSGITTTDRIVVKEGVTADITLDNVDIQFIILNQWGDGKAAFHISKNASVTITLANTNILTSNGTSSGLEVPKSASVIIQGDGKLTATGGTSSGDAGAGIGARKGWGSGNITIKSGIIIANGGNGYGSFKGNYSGYGIGSYFGENVIINGGTIAAKGGSNATSGNGSDLYNPIINGGTFTNCKKINNIVSMDDTNCTFTNCNLSFKNPTTLTKDYSGCTLKDNITINGGTFTNCSIFGNKVIINKGTINNLNTDINNNISGDNVIINGGTINISCHNKPCIDVSGSKFLEINGGNINVNTQISYGGAPVGEAAVIGPGQGASCGTIIINGGLVNAKLTGQLDAGGAAIGGAGKTWNGGSDKDGGKITINGGTITAVGSSYGDIGEGWNEAEGIVNILGGSVNAKKIKTLKNDVYLGITPEIANATDVSVDGIPYYISGNHPESDNKLYLYMTGTDHTITVRKNDSNVTTYTATYAAGGVDSDGSNKGYFKFDASSTTTPTDNSAITFEAKDVTTTYNKESNELKVKLIVTAKVTTRSAAMNSVQLTLTEGTNTYYSDRQTVTGSGEYEFTFDTQGLNAGDYTLTANYGGSTTSLTADEQTATLTIEKAEGSKAFDYKVPNALSAIYGETLADVTLPEGWAWNDDLTTSVGNVISSPNTFTATFTPADTKNYNTIVKDLSVTVNKAMSGNVEEPKVTSPSSVTYGIMLSEITITDGWEWADETIVPIVNNSNYPVYYPVTDYTNYNWSWSSIYSETHHRLEYTVIVTVNKADPTAADFTFTAPSNLVYDGKEKTATVTAKEGLIGIGDITLKYYNEKRESVAAPTEVGTYIVKIDVAGGDNYNLASDLTTPEWTFTILPKSNPPVNPPVDPDDPDEPAPVRYTVTLPTVEGVATDPTAGSYEVESWGSFSFLLTLGEGYQKDSNPIVTARGETLTPNTSTGKYIIPNVQSDITVGITGIVKDVATGNESLTDGFRITTSGGLLLVTVPRATRLYLTDTSGRLILTRLLPAGDTRIDDLAAGVYLLTLEGKKTKKIIIR